MSDRTSAGDGPRKRATLEVGLFVLYLVACLALLPHLPASWDELGNRNVGEIGLQMARDYLRTGQPAEQVFLHEHGTALEMLLMGVEKVVGGDLETDPVTALRIRHTAIFSIFALAAFCFYLLVRDLFASRSIGLLGFALLALHPRIFHHAFHNASDIGFLSFCVFWIFTLQRLAREPSWRTALAHALACALAVDSRVVAIYFVGVSVFVLMSQVLVRGGPRRAFDRRQWLSLAVWPVAFVALVVLLWPFLWGRPVSNLVWAVSQFARFDVPFRIRYLGELIWSTEVPWHYNPVWFVITTPWYVVLGAAVGSISFLRRVWRDPGLLAAAGGLPVAVALWVSVPILAPMLLGSTLFNGWRHHFFVYPGIVLMAVYGLVAMIEAISRRWPGLDAWRARRVLAGVVLAHLLSILAWLHPYQNLYFSPVTRLFGRQQGTHHLFETDYWCTSYREALEFLARQTRGTIYVAGYWKPLWLNSLWLPDEDRQRIVLVRDVAEADFYLGVFRQTGPEGYPSGSGTEVHAIHRGDLQILSLRLLRQPTFQARPVRSALPERPSDLRRLFQRVWTDGPAVER